MIQWVDNSLGQARCAGSNVFPSGYMQDAAPDPLPGMAQPVQPKAPSTAEKPYEGSDWGSWLPAIIIGGVAGLIFWRTIA